MSEQEQTLMRQDVKDMSGQIVKELQNRNKKKFKATVYLTEEAEKAFTELYIHRLRKDRKIDRSMIACDALQALYEKECLGVASN